MENILFNDISHFYLGCYCFDDGYQTSENIGVTGKLHGISNVKNSSSKLYQIIDKEGNIFNSRKIIPYLRPLSDITFTESEIINNEYGSGGIGSYLSEALINENKFVKDIFQTFELASYLLERKFDLFDLIKNGEALEYNNLILKDE